MIAQIPCSAWHQLGRIAVGTSRGLRRAPGRQDGADLLGAPPPGAGRPGPPGAGASPPGAGPPANDAGTASRAARARRRIAQMAFVCADGQIQRAAKKYKDSGVTIHIVKFGLNTDMPDEEIDYCFNVAKALGCKAVTCEPPLEPNQTAWRIRREASDTCSAITATPT